VRGVFVQKQEVFSKPGRPWGRYVVGCVLFLIAAVASKSGGTVSPVVFVLAGAVLVSWSHLRRLGLHNRVVPVRDSVLLRSRLLPFAWHALVEVKLESLGQTRGIAALSGRLLLFAGKTPSVFQVVSVFAPGYRQAEEAVAKKLRLESRMLSQRGAHLLPVDSADAATRLYHVLERLNVGTDDFEAVSSLPFDSIVFRVQDGRVVSHRAFNVLEPNGVATIPAPDLTYSRDPLFAEVVQEIGEKHGWPGPDEFSPFLASLDASRSEPLVDRFQMKDGTGERLTVETPGGSQVRLTRAQLRALARIYA
jgi:hypothetical protein